MRIEMAVENNVPDSFRQAARSVENVQGVTFLRAECDGIQNGGDRILGFQTPLMIVEVEHMGLLHAAVDEPYF